MKLQKGFSLIELLIVIAIVGIILAIAFSNFRGRHSQQELRAVELLESRGYSGVTIVDSCTKPTKCDCASTDSIAFKTEATDANNTVQKLTVCVAKNGSPRILGTQPSF
jgi:prepilin-type N-terminal cleavage/methylation domain-containing protein